MTRRLRDVCVSSTATSLSVLTVHTATRIALMALALCVATSCQQQPQQVSGPIAKEPSDMRTTVPLVRALDPSQTGPIELEFDVPAQQDDDAPPLFIGVRVAGSDLGAVYDAAEELRRADVSAEVHLFRIQASGLVAVELTRSQRVGWGEVERVSIGADGLVPELGAMDADFSSMQAAGLLPVGVEHRELAFAYTPNLPSGRYRVAVRLAQNREALLAAKAELLIAYIAKGK